MHDLKLAPKLRQHHLELLSNSVSQALGYLKENNLGTRDSTTPANFCNIFNDWFDLMNSSQSDSAYGTHKE
ncbi:hypothetical protein PR048_023624 [Dryococelus australis]|uniref:Transposable element P transposase-like GTP-binding insertion domain-containing protein n=1 Tax=Dryococelus australis TaxID=614101 RepID=A0ABQ9GUJ7_9NEOP|nr:hypothetical protein PR048_023624 [Dryococelus australis]